MTKFKFSLIILVCLIIGLYTFSDEILYVDEPEPTILVIERRVPYEVIRIKEIIKRIYINKIVYKYIVHHDDSNDFHLLDDAAYENIISEIFANTLEKLEESQPPKRNRITALLGYGPTGVHLSAEGSTVTGVPSYGAVYGLQYERQLVGDFGLTLQYQSNKTYSLGIGFDF